MYRVSKDDLCSSCLSIRPRMNDGSLGDSIGSMLDSVGYNKPEGPAFMNSMILVYLEDDGGCPACISLFRGDDGYNDDDNDDNYNYDDDDDDDDFYDDDYDDDDT